MPSINSLEHLCSRSELTSQGLNPCYKQGSMLACAGDKEIKFDGVSLCSDELRVDPRGVLPFSLLLMRVGFFLSSLHQCYSLRTFAHLKEHS